MASSSGQKITGSGTIDLQNAAELLLTAQSDVKFTDGLEYQIQVSHVRPADTDHLLPQIYPDDVNLNVYFCIRHSCKDPNIIVADADVTVSIVEEGTGNQVMKRRARVARPSGHSFRDYMSVFKRQDLVMIKNKQKSETMTFKADFSVRLVPIRFGDPDARLMNPQRMKVVTGLDPETTENDVWLVATRDAHGEELDGHKDALCQRSSFYRNLFQDPDNADVDLIRVHVAWKSLLTFSRYCYAAEIVIHPDRVFDLMQDALTHQFYDISFAIGSLVTKDTVFQVKKWAEEISDSAISDMCEQFIVLNVDMFLKKDQFVKLDVYAIQRILQEDDIAVSETQIWNLTQDWLVAEVDRQKCGASTKQMRKLMKPFLYQIRIPIMSMADFVRGPISSMILNAAEIKEVMLFMTERRPCTLFPCEPRPGQEITMDSDEENVSKKRKTSAKSVKSKK